MKLPAPTTDTDRACAEFDVWITPALGQVRSTDRFRDEMRRIVNVLETIGAISDEFRDDASGTPPVIARSFAKLANESDGEGLSCLSELASVLFLATGKSDNSAKCQFPLFLRDHARWPGLPHVASRGSLDWKPLPRTLKAERVMRQVMTLTSFPAEQSQLLEEYVAFLLSSDEDVVQLRSLGRSYFLMKRLGHEAHLLTPLVAFKVRGSVAATEGHVPEGLLRGRLRQWGMKAGVDFNTSDVNWVQPGQDATMSGKTRAWDFVLPYRTPGWKQRIFVQCQFYAGDSGSVSHKNVDQTPRERGRVREFVRDAVFVEYVDGAGYFASLNRDLRHLLTMETTAGFFQLRSAAIRLRWALQDIGFLTPLEIAHALMLSGGSRGDAVQRLRTDGYDAEEVERGVAFAMGERYLIPQGRDGLELEGDFRKTARRYMLLDLAALRGVEFQRQSQLAGCLIVPGYGPFRGLPLEELKRLLLRTAPSLAEDWAEPSTWSDDVQWLVAEGLAMVGR